MCDADLSGDACSVWSERDRRARKEHRCDGCNAAIRVGELYLVHRSLFDGNWSTEKMCGACGSARKAFAEAHPGGLIPVPSNLHETLVDCIADGDEESERRWKPMLEALKARGQAVANG